MPARLDGLPVKVLIERIDCFKFYRGVVVCTKRRYFNFESHPKQIHLIQTFLELQLAENKNYFKKFPSHKVFKIMIL